MHRLVVAALNYRYIEEIFSQEKINLSEYKSRLRTTIDYF